MNSIRFATCCSLLFAFTFTQAQKTIQFRDADQGKPIAGVHFQADQLKGISDEEGKFQLPASTRLLHIIPAQHTSILLRDQALAKAISDGYILLQPRTVVLAPVSLYTLRGKPNQTTQNLFVQDWIHHDGGQVLQQIAGFSAIRKSNIYGADPVFRGMKLNQLLVIADGGMSAIAACPNRMDPPTSQIMMSQMQEVEILQGPHSFRYGPTTGAVIHFKSSDAQFAAKPTHNGRVSSSYESNGGVFRSEMKWTDTRQRTQWNILASHSTGNDYRDGNDSIIPASFRRSSVAIQAHHRMPGNQVLSWNVSHNKAKDSRFPTLMMDLLDDNTVMAQAQYKKRWINRNLKQFTMQGFASHVDHVMGTALRPAGMSMATSTAKTATAGARAELQWKLNRWSGFSGLDYRYETADGYRQRIMRMGPMAGRTFRDTLWQDGSLQRAGLFTEGTLNWWKYNLHVAARVDLHHAEAQNPTTQFKRFISSFDHREINTSMSIGISRQWNNNWFTGVWIGRGIRPASLTERFINYLAVGTDPYELVGNPSLKNEATNQLDAVTKWQNGNTRLQLNAFAGLMSNYITAVIDTTKRVVYGGPGVRQYVNVRSALLTGFEFQWEQSWSPSLQQQTSIAYTYGRNQVTDSPLPEIAPIQIQSKFTGSYWHGRIQPFLQARYVGEQNRIASNFGERKTADFATLDAGVHAEPIKNIRASVTVTNIFDRAYREHLSRYIRPTLPLNAPGRSAVITLSYNFGSSTSKNE